MNSISIFEIFKIGVGPSSSHTMGPWNAALAFVNSLEINTIDKIQVHLYGSLSKTGRGHATDKAVVLGLMGYKPASIDTNSIEAIVAKLVQQKILEIDATRFPFDMESDIIFEKTEHKLHPNTLLFRAYANNKLCTEQLFASVGGGFIEQANASNRELKVKIPYPVDKGSDLLHYTHQNDCSISDIVFKNELKLRPEKEIILQIERLFDVMLDAVYNGCTKDGILPGGLGVERRAKKITNSLTENSSFNSKQDWIRLIESVPKSFAVVNTWVSCFAIAVNEENAAMGRIVTSPTNGAAGVIPAVLLYYRLFCDNTCEDYLRKFFLTAGEIGCLFKKGATLSAAVGGCQAEIGVSSAMAAAGLTEILGGTPEQCLVAAEIAMEHHLGLTCDPIKGLVQIPCIERNAMGAIKAITAAHLVLKRAKNESVVDIDTVIKTMWEVAVNMHSKYKETAEGGLAVNLNVANPNC